MFVPLIVLAVAGWKKTALRLLVPCLLLLLYLNWPPLGRIDDRGDYLLNFSLLQPAEEGPGAHLSEAEFLAELRPHEAWDWSGWYWLWPNQLASWVPLVWALVLVGGAELLRRWLRNVRDHKA